MMQMQIAPSPLVALPKRSLGDLFYLLLRGTTRTLHLPLISLRTRLVECLLGRSTDETISHNPTRAVKGNIEVVLMPCDDSSGSSALGPEGWIDSETEALEEKLRAETVVGFPGSGVILEEVTASS